MRRKIINRAKEIKMIRDITKNLKQIKRQYAIKVCRMEGEELISYNSYQEEEYLKWRLKYNLGKKTKSKEGLIFVYNNLKNAENRVGRLSCNKFFRCKVGKTFSPPDLDWNAVAFSYASFWQRIKQIRKKQRGTRHSFPPGTLLTDEVTLIKEV